MTIPQSGWYIAGGGLQVVSTCGTAVPLSTSTTAIPCTMVVYSMPSSNTGVVCIGNSTVIAATTGRTGLSIAGGGSTGFIYAKDLTNVYIDSTVSTEGISYIYYLNTVP